MRWQTKFLLKFERVAIPNLTGYWIAFMALGMFLIWGRPAFAENLVLDTEKVLQGEWWRLLTFLFMPEELNPIFAAFALYLFWLMGSALEANWGTARYNIFLLTGAVLNIIGAFIPLLAGHPGSGTNYYLLSTVFLGFAALYPDFQIRVFFVLPVAVKWLALMTWLLIGVAFVFSDWTGKAMIIASMGNFLLFFWKHLLEQLKFRHKTMVRKARWMAKSMPSEPQDSMHRCIVCGATERSAPQLEFRYCATCGNRCYCLEHLRTHACMQQPVLK